MLTASLILLSLIIYVYLGYFILVLLLGLIFNKKVYKDKDFTPNVCFMIAAYNEEKDIADKIKNTLLLNYPKNKLNIVVVSDASNDKTDEIVKSFSHQGVKLIRVEGRVGKTEARNQALKQINEEYIVFSDATTEYTPNSLRALMQNFNDSDVGMVTGHLLYKDYSESQIGLGQKLFWKYESLIKKAQTRLGSLTGSIGCITAFRKEYYHNLPAHIIEDFTSPLMFVKAGKRVVFEEEALCYEKTTTNTTQEWNMRVRVIRGGITGLLYAKAILNPFKYPLASFQLISHKLLRWLVPYIAIVLFIVSTMGLLMEGSVELTYLVFLQILYYTSVLANLGLKKLNINIKVLGVPYYLFVVNACSLVAIFKTLTTEIEATWETDRAH
jgi:cellulose synthase/poly-beta-1,6-N-acetylglucosamine synthase-like glycosyltransferase